MHHLIASHGGEHKIAGTLATSLSDKQVNVRSYICDGPMKNPLKPRSETELVIKDSSVLIVELSDYSTGAGTCVTAERNALEIAVRCGIPCILIVNRHWHVAQTDYLKIPVIKDGIIRVVITNDVTAKGEEELMRQFPNASALRFSEATIGTIADEMITLGNAHDPITAE